eukprot:CAMPEP_0185793964 /NCGR_PEP_ID=MMETSP1174-20130828/159760_1 /TAXON_ID=35687 /ORGANISM="Dictyocha speculum, Strain CCMP1381" /LENGTH=570 /DNA_ID=CAMNT_0028489157 /DNA_START=96 /DNA_END=1808 /DNA_ORIENTATION=+
MRFPDFQTVILALEIYRCLCAQPPDRNMHVDDGHKNEYLCVKPDPQKQLYSFKPKRQLDCPVCTAGCKNNSKVSLMQFEMARGINGTNRGMGSICSMIIHSAAVAHLSGSAFAGVAAYPNRFDLFQETSHGVYRRAIIDLLFGNADLVVKQEILDGAAFLKYDDFKGITVKNLHNTNNPLNTLKDLAKLRRTVTTRVGNYFAGFDCSKLPINLTSDMITDDFVLSLRLGSQYGIRRQMRHNAWSNRSWSFQHFRNQITARFWSNNNKKQTLSNATLFIGNKDRAQQSVSMNQSEESSGHVGGHWSNNIQRGHDGKRARKRAIAKAARAAHVSSAKGDEEDAAVVKTAAEAAAQSDVQVAENRSKPYIIKVARHVREGDGGHPDPDVKATGEGKLLDKYTYELLNGLEAAVFLLYGTQVRVDMHVFTSCARVNQCVRLRKQTAFFKNHHIHLHVHEEMAEGKKPTKDLKFSLAHFITADVLILARSTLSYVAGIFNPNCVVHEPTERFGSLKDWSILQRPDEDDIEKIRKESNSTNSDLDSDTVVFYRNFWLKYLSECLKIPGDDEDKFLV